MFTDSTSAMQLMTQRINTVVNFDSFGGREVFTAVVLTRPVILQHADITSTHSGVVALGQVSKFAFKARIIDDPSPHYFLPDPCDVALSAHPARQLARVFLHTTFISSDDYTLSSDTMPRVGDHVNVRLTKNVFSYELGFGDFIGVKVQGGTDMNISAESCENLDDSFLSKYQVPKTSKVFETGIKVAAGESAAPSPVDPPDTATPTATAAVTPLTIPAKYTKVFFGDSQMQGAFGSKLEEYLGTATRVAAKSTQPRDWRRCVGSGKCTASSVAVPAKVKQLWAAIDKVPDLVVISLAGNGISHLDDLISDIAAVIDGKKTMVIWQGAPPPIHKKDNGTGTTFYGNLTKYNDAYAGRHKNSMTAKTKVEAKGWKFVDPYKHLVMSDGTVGYACPACDGVHLTNTPATQVIMSVYPSLLEPFLVEAVASAE